MFIIKNDGRREPYSTLKIKESISHATNGLDVNPLVLESKFNKVVVDGMTTDDIQANLVEHAKQLCSPQETDWAFVAGRLETMRRWKKCAIFDKSFHYYLKEQIKSKVYKHNGLDVWSKHEIIKLGEVINHNKDLNHSYGSIITANKKYLLQNETIQHMHMVNAMIIASVEDEEKRLDLAKDIYHALSDRKMSLATPWLSNLRSGKNISSCFIIGVEDSLDSITNAWKNAATISKYGGGLGVDMSCVRSSNATINGRPKSSKGVVPWIKVFNDIAVAVDQNGARAGAFTIHVPIWHRDIEDFIEIQSENKDPRRQCFDIFPQVGIFDIFMEEQMKEGGGIWYTFCPYEVETVMGFKLQGSFNKEFSSKYKKCVKAHLSGKLTNVGIYNAKELVKMIMKTQFETGLPYLAFLDTINERNPNNHAGYIPSVNLCCESFSNTKEGKYAHCCNLASIVAGRIDSIEELEHITRLCVKVLDNGIQLTQPPIQEAKNHNDTYRTIGIGIQGLHDYLAKNDLTYNDVDSITSFVEHIEYYAISESVNLSKKLGPYSHFQGSQWQNGSMIKRFKNHSVTSLDWDALQNDIETYGIRNSQLTSPAPNTSTAILMDASAGFMPIYRGFFIEDNSTGKFPVFGMYIKEKPLSYEQTQPRMDQSKLSYVVGKAQNFIDTGISSEYVFDHNKEGFNAKELHNLWESAWKNKTKAVYYIRSIKKGKTIDSLLGGESVCVGCSG